MVTAGRIGALLRDAAAIIGAGLVSYGAWLTYEPLGFVTLGALLVVAAINASLAGG